MSESSFSTGIWSTGDGIRSVGPRASNLGDDVRSVTPEMLSLGDNIRNMDPVSDIACSSRRPKISNFDPYKVDSILSSEDLEVLS